jgi:hypothetical protein
VPLATAARILLGADGESTGRTASPSGERALLRHSRAPWKAGRGRADFSEQNDAIGVALEATPDELAGAGDPFAFGGLTEPEDDGSAAPDERRAQLHRDGRLRESLRESDVIRLERLLLCPSPHDLDVLQLTREAVEEHALSTFALEKRELAVGERDREREAR